MFNVAILLVIGSGFLHSVWNLYTKRSINKNVFLWFCQLVAVFVFLPWTIVQWEGVHILSTGGWIIVASMLLHGLYVILLAKTYSIGDLSQVYPIMRGTSPLLVPLLGVTLLNEKLSVLGWIGVLFIVIGIVLISNITFNRTESSTLRVPLLALAVGVCIASYIVVDKVALSYYPAVVINEATNIGNLFVLSWATFNSKAIRTELRVNWRIILLGGIIAPASYLLFLYAASLAPLAQLAPMREIGTVFGTIMGIFILREKQGRRRLITSILITTGVILLGIWG
ncbi:DMT family transporter [Cohnella abietis]|uniref:Membrane protein n=1 Tax=Cohnella abietis TaxID=2507935 RepID=A0A3T1DA14_9BACL|nr:DMT family transporter [Cohnella abietis]BBI34913.1 membrane protein [Cohnella abietis]